MTDNKKKRSSLDRSFLIKDTMVNLKVGIDQAEQIWKYLRVFLLEELLYSGQIRVGDIGILKTKPSQDGPSISFVPFKNFLEDFRRKYRIVHSIKPPDNTKNENTD